MYVKKFCFSDLSIEIRSDRKIANSDNCIQFLSDIDNPEYSIDIVSGPLPEYAGEIKAVNGNHYYLMADSGIKYYSQISDDKKYACFELCEKRGVLYIDYEDGLWDSMIIDALDIPSLLLEKDALLLHGSCIEYMGKAIVFTAPRGTGKSTQAGLWEQYENAKIINGDRISLQIENGRVMAFGTPYCGTSGICLNRKLETNAIICLSQGTDNEAILLDDLSAFLKIYEGISLSREFEDKVQKATDIILNILKIIPVYSFSCTPDYIAVEKLKEILK